MTDDERLSAAESNDIVARTIAERGKVYGDPHQSHTNLGLAWTGLLQAHFEIELPHPIPASVVELMMVDLKIIRSARFRKEDTYIDARAYLGFAENSQIGSAAKLSTLSHAISFLRGINR